MVTNPQEKGPAHRQHSQENQRQVQGSVRQNPDNRIEHGSQYPFQHGNAREYGCPAGVGDLPVHEGIQKWRTKQAQTGNPENCYKCGEYPRKGPGSNIEKTGNEGTEKKDPANTEMFLYGTGQRKEEHRRGNPWRIWY